jgi:acyl-CoA dehydrogenase
VSDADLSTVAPISGPDVDVDDLLTESATRLLGDVAGFEAVQAAEATGWSAPIWEAVAAAGFPWIGLPEDAGGSGGTLADACEVLLVSGAHAAPIPLAETALLGGWLLASSGLPLPDGPVTVAPGRPDDTLSVRIEGGRAVLDGTVHRVAWAARSDVLALLDPATGRVIAAPRDAYSVEVITNMAGEPRETVSFDAAEVDAVAAAPPDVSPGALRARGALSRVMLMAGALEAMVELTVGYAEERQQFGRPIGRFQAVQQHLVWSAQDAALAGMAARVAARQAARGDGRFEIAAARSIADQCATTATRQCHQAHGAMGMTQEYPLHHLSRRLWSWRSEWTGPGEWARQVGRFAEDVGAANLYPLVTAGSALLD